MTAGSVESAVEVGFSFLDYLPEIVFRDDYSGQWPVSFGPVKVDSRHYKVEFENDQVRVLRITFAPGEKSVMHEHRAGVVVALTDHRVKFHFPNGKTEERTAKARGAQWVAAKKLLTENVGDKPVEVILAGISILSFPFTRKPMPRTLSCQPQTALASLRW